MADRTIFLLLLGGTPGSIHISTHFGQEGLFNMYIDHLRHRYRQQREQQQPCIKKSVSGYAFHSIYILPRIFDACKFQRITIHPIPDAAPNRKPELYSRHRKQHTSVIFPQRYGFLSDLQSVIYILYYNIVLSLDFR